MEVTRTFDILDRYQKLFPGKKDALAGKYDGSWILYSSEDYISHANWLSYGLMHLGLKKGDMVATISNNRPEWNFMDMGLSQAGIVHIPIYPTISKEEYDYILHHAEPKLIVVSDKLLYSKIKSIIKTARFKTELCSYDKIEGVKNWTDILESGRQNESLYSGKLEKIKASVSPHDMVTMIYTSGTTGFPKGVMLSHDNIVSNLKAIEAVHNLNSTQRVLSFLPLCHVYERTVNYHFQYMGLGIYYAESMGTIVQDINDVKPHAFNSVPRLLERVYDKIIGKGKDLPFIKKHIFFWAVNLGLKYRPEGNGLWYDLKLKIARRLVFSKWKAGLGGNVEIIVSGGAALQQRLACIFWAAGIKVLEGYGLTETSPVIAVNNLRTMEVTFGTVGTVLEGTQVKIAEDGEILCKGPGVMMGYYKAPELTSQVIDSDGWFHTGDIGVMINGKFLMITDRKKEIFKLSSGKYVAPQVIENRLKESLFIENAMVIGENQKFASALISPNYEFLHNWASLHGIKFRDNEELISFPQVTARFQKEVNTINTRLGQTDQIKRFRLVSEEWNPQNGFLSPTLKLKRNVLDHKYKSLIKQIYMMNDDTD